MKAQQFWLYICDDSISAMQYKLLCTTQDKSPWEDHFVWSSDEEGKMILPDWEPKPCKPLPMKNVEDIIKGNL